MLKASPPRIEKNNALPHFMSRMPSRAFQLHASDNVATLIDDAQPGPVQCVGEVSTPNPVLATEPINRGHKIALADLPAGAAVLKFGVRIGHTTQPVARGAWVHLHNLASDLDERSSSLELHSGAPTDTAKAYI
jgi:altronate dehydratase small subunit